MKKILFVITKSNWGGAQRYVYNLATSLAASRDRGQALPPETYSLAVALGGTGVAGSEPGELAQKLASAGIPIFGVKSFARDVSLFSDVYAFFELLKIYKAERPDVVHLNSSKAGGVGALAARFAGVKKIIFTSHGLAWDEDRNFVAKSLIYLFSRFTFLLCHKVIVISNDNFQRARECWLCRNKFVLVHNGLPELTFETRERARVSLALKVGVTEGTQAPENANQEKSLKVQGGEFWIGSIAELTKNKGLPYLIQAVSEVARGIVSASAGSATNNAPVFTEHGGKLPAFHLFIIGSGEEEANLKALIKEKNLESIVHLVGFVSDAYRYDKAFDLFVLSSVKEGLPTVLLEAGQANIPVISTNIAGAKDIVEDNISGLLVEPKDPTGLAIKIKELMENPQKRQELASNLNQKVLREFSIDRMAEETKKLYI